MKPENLIPISELNEEQLKTLFKVNPKFANNVRGFVSDRECELIWEDFGRSFDSLKVRYEVEFGPWTNTKFRVMDMDSVQDMKDFLEAVEEIIGKGHLNKTVLRFTNHALTLCNKYLEDDFDDDSEEVNDRLAEEMKDTIHTVCVNMEAEIRRYLRCVGDMLENDDYILQDVENFAEWREDLFVDSESEDGKVYRISEIESM